MRYTAPNVRPTKELVEIIASPPTKLRFVKQLANTQKSTFTPGQHVCGLSKILRYAPRTYCAPLFFSAEAPSVFSAIFLLVGVKELPSSSG